MSSFILWLSINNYSTIWRIKYFINYFILLSRFIVGNCFALTYFSQSSYEFSVQKLKYWIIFLIGLIIGSIFIFNNEIFSNSELNSWAWKVIYSFNLLLVFLLYIFF